MTAVHEADGSVGGNACDSGTCLRTRSPLGPSSPTPRLVLSSFACILSRAVSRMKTPSCNVSSHENAADSACYPCDIHYPIVVL
jgi:hypothetical protein